jgi:hypothetical protein
MKKVFFGNFKENLDKIDGFPIKNRDNIKMKIDLNYLYTLIACYKKSANQLEGTK